MRCFRARRAADDVMRCFPVNLLNEMLKNARTHKIFTTIKIITKMNWSNGCFTFCAEIERASG